MQKTGLKTFVYSFSVSLFAIFATNGIYLHMHPSDTRHIKIPSKNVTLFLKDTAFNPSLKPAPVKKIALSVLPELEKKPDISLPAGSIVYEPPADEVIMADNFIPLESGGIFEEPAVSDSAPEQSGIVPPPAPQKEVLTAAAAPAPKADDSIVIPRKAPQIPVQKPAAAVRTAEAAPTAKKQVMPPEPKQAEPEKPILVAENKLPQPLFPLEKAYDAGLNGRKIKIGEPDALNQVALADKSIPISSMENRQAEAAPPPAWEQMSDKKTDSPWVVAKADGAVKNGMLTGEDYYKKENEQIKRALDAPTTEKKDAGVKVASETVKNLLIPIPEDILNDDNLVPQLSYSSNEKEKAKDKEFDEKIAAQNKNSAPQETAKPEAPAKPAKENILASLNTIFSSSTKVKETKKEPEKSGDLLSELKKKLSPSKKVTIMPTEMRLSFQPNRAEISGQTLRWIQAFASRAAEDNTLSIEIRIDGTSGMELQQKRLNLLHNILTNKGVEYSKINTVFTSREPNSFIIRTVDRNIDRRGLNRNNNTRTAGHYLQW